MYYLKKVAHKSAVFKISQYLLRGSWLQIFTSCLVIFEKKSHVYVFFLIIFRLFFLTLNESDISYGLIHTPPFHEKALIKAKEKKTFPSAVLCSWLAKDI